MAQQLFDLDVDSYSVHQAPKLAVRFRLVEDLVIRRDAQQKHSNKNDKIGDELYH